MDTLTTVVADFGDSDAETIHDSSDATLNNLEKYHAMGNFGSSYAVRFKNKVSDTTITFGNRMTEAIEVRSDLSSYL